MRLSSHSSAHLTSGKRIFTSVHSHIAALLVLTFLVSLFFLCPQLLLGRSAVVDRCDKPPNPRKCSKFRYGTLSFRLPIYGLVNCKRTYGRTASERRIWQRSLLILLISNSLLRRSGWYLRTVFPFFFLSFFRPTGLRSLGCWLWWLAIIQLIKKIQITFI